MLPKIRQRSWEVGQSLAGDGMLLRLRNASIALVGAVAAVGLGLTLFISQLGFPAVFNGPIPDGPTTRAGSVHEAVALTDSPAVGSSSSPARVTRSAATDPGRPGRPGRGDGGAGHDGSRQTAVSPGAQKGPAEPQLDPVTSQPGASVPVAVPTAPSAAPSPAVPSPAPAPAVVVSPSKSTADGQLNGTADGKSKPSAPSTAKVTSDGKSKGRETGKSDGSSASVGKSTSPAEKAAKDQSTAAAPKPVAPPAPAPSEKQASEAASPAAAKEAADSGRSDGSRH